MKTKLISIIIFIFFLISSCYKNYRYNIDNDKIVSIICFLKEDDTVRVNVSYTSNLNEVNDFDDKYINDANVYLYENNQLKEKLINKKNEFSEGWYFSRTFIPKENNEYELKVSVPGNDTVYAKTFIPSKVKIDSIIDLFDYSINEYGDTAYSLTHLIKFTDNKKVNNYYSFNISNFNSVTHYKSYDPVIENKNMGSYFSYISDNISNIPYFSDTLFSNNSYSLKILNYFHYFYPDTMIFYDELFSLSKDAYLFYKSSFLQYSTRENPLSEPVVIYSNVKNGTGIFAGMSSDIDSIILIKNQIK